MKKIFILLLSISLFSAYVNAQLAVYTGTGGTSTGVVASAANETVSSLSDVGFGTNTPCSSGGLSGITVSTAWTTYSASGPHVYFQILPNPGYTLTVTNYYAWTRESATGPTLARLAYSLDGGTTWVSDMDHTQSGCTGTGCCGSYMNLMNWLGATGPSLSGITSTNGIIVAIYPFAPSSSSGTFQVQYMEVDGTVNVASAAPVITSNPTDVTICSGSNTSFSSTATGTPTPTYQWQRSATGTGGPWVNITTGMDGGIYGSSFTTNTLTLTGATTAENGYAYQMIATNTVGSATSTPALLTVITTPVVAAITGTASLCSTGTTTLSETTTGGTWSSTSTSIATVSSTGVVSGVASGTATISYTVTNACGTGYATAVVTVTPPAAAITGITPICTGATTTLHNTTAGGTWTSGTPTVATISAASGIVTGISQGVTNITYTVINACGTTTATMNVTIDTAAATISGITNICTGATTTLSNTTIGGTWSSSNTAVATINASTGVVTGVSGGTSTITYAVTNVCGTSSAIVSITVNAPAGVISGSATICVGAVTILTNSTPGGTWNSDNPLVAAIGAGTGALGGISQGPATITYSVTNACGTTTATMPVTVNRPASVISGNDSVCIGASISLSDSTIGGTWSATNANANITGAGVAYGILQGLDSIKYVVTNVCGTTTAMKVVYIKALPVAGVIHGPGSVCTGMQIVLNDSITGGAWSCSNSNAVIMSPGVVKGVSSGMDTVFYVVTNSCGTAIANLPFTIITSLTPSVTISASPSLLLCPDVTVTFTPVAVNGGAAPIYHWMVNGVLSGTGSSFVYIPSNSDVVKCEMTSNATCPLPDSAGNSVTLTVNPPVKPSVSFISSGGDTVCAGLNNTFIAIPVNGGSAPLFQWSVNWVNVAAGDTFSYIPANGDIIKCSLTSNGACVIPDTAGNTKILTVLPYHTPGINISVSPSDAICQGNDATLIVSQMNGGYAPAFYWTKNGVNFSNNTSFTYKPATGDSFSCTMVSNYHCVIPSDTATANVVLNVSPVIEVTITGRPGLLLTRGTYDTLTANVINAGISPAYQWYKNGIMIPGATGPRLIENDFKNKDSISCMVTTGSGTPCQGIKGFNWAILEVAPVGINTISNGTVDFKISPNPNSGVFSIEGSIPCDDKEVILEVTDVIGQVICRKSSIISNGQLNEVINLDSRYANGIYLLYVMSGNKSFIARFIVGR